MWIWEGKSAWGSKENGESGRHSERDDDRVTLRKRNVILPFVTFPILNMK